MEIKSILAFDLDGTLTKRNTLKILPEALPSIFSFLNSLGHNVIPVTGKPAPYALRIVTQNNIQQAGIIAENAGVFIRPGETNTEVYGDGVESIHTLKELLGLQADTKGITQIKLNNVDHEMVVDPEDYSILTLFTDPTHVAHRWTFTKTISTEDVYQNLVSLVNNNELATDLSVLAPFPDGGLQVVRKNKSTGKVIDKSSLSDVVKIMLNTHDTIPVAMFGDGHNDIPAMGSEGVTPLTFNNAEEEVKRFVQNNSGYVSKYDAPEAVGVLDCLIWLASATDHFGSDATVVKDKIFETFPDLR